MAESSPITGQSPSEALATVLGELRTGNPDISASALFSDDGLLVAGSLPDHADEILLGGMSATLLSTASKAAGELDLGDLRQALIRGEDGYAVLVGASKNTMLMTLAKPDAKPGLVFIEMSRAVEQIRSII